MVTIRIRLCIAFLVLTGAVFYALVGWMRDDLRPGFQQSMEESMVDTATLLASWAELRMSEDAIPADELRRVFNSAQRRQLNAHIYALTKTKLDMRVYVTDRNGLVVFDSDGGRDEGKDYSKWNNIVRTLRGEYGARATRALPDDPMSATLHVSSPIMVDGQIVGVLTVAKAAESVKLFVKMAENKFVLAAVWAAVAVILLGMVASFWVTRPIEKLTRYANAVRDGARVTAPKLGRSEIGALGVAFEEMRIALEGKRYVEEYIQTLTHEMKSPLSAIRGAAELIDESMPPDERGRFVSNIRTETVRLQDMIDRMLQLAAIENRNELRDVESIELGELARDATESMQPVLAAKQLAVRVRAETPVRVDGERFLIRQAVTNLLQNAADFSPPGAEIDISVAERNGSAEISVRDRGPGIPAYALDKVFDRFYSLSRPDTGKKSSGLGLSLVREVAHLHEGRVSIENHPDGGARATLTLPAHSEPERR